MKYVKLSLLLSFLLFFGTAQADHLPENLLASGQPETTLASINLKATKLTDVIKMYGPPMLEEKTSRDPDWTSYIWKLPNAKLEVEVHSGPSGTQITDVYVEGTVNGPVGSTGRGLQLGDDIKTLERIYGNKFKLSTLRNDSSEKREDFMGVMGVNKRVTIQWDLEEFTLTVGLDNKGKISAMWLILPEWYPDGCE